MNTIQMGLMGIQIQKCSSIWHELMFVAHVCKPKPTPPLHFIISFLQFSFHSQFFFSFFFASFYLLVSFHKSLMVTNC
jgi:hypothetical protein